MSLLSTSEYVADFNQPGQVLAVADDELRQLLRAAAECRNAGRPEKEELARAAAEKRA